MPVVRVRIGTFHYPLLLPEVASGALVTTLLWGLLVPCCCQCCGLGHWYGRYLHHVWDLLGPLQWGERVGAVRSWGLVLLPRSGLSVSWTLLLWAEGPESHGFLWLEGWCRSCCLVPCSRSHCCGWEARVIVSPALLLLGFLWGSLLWLGIQDCRYHLHCFPSPASSVYFSPSTLFFVFVFFLFGHAVCGILVPRQGSKQTRPLAVRVWHPDYWTAREFSVYPVVCTVVQMCGILCNPDVWGRDTYWVKDILLLIVVG